jgi:hypothetical protein
MRWWGGWRRRNKGLGICRLRRQIAITINISADLDVRNGSSQRYVGRLSG